MMSSHKARRDFLVDRLMDDVIGKQKTAPPPPGSSMVFDPVPPTAAPMSTSDEDHTSTDSSDGGSDHGRHTGERTSTPPATTSLTSQAAAALNCLMLNQQAYFAAQALSQQFAAVGGGGGAGMFGLNPLHYAALLSQQLMNAQQPLHQPFPPPHSHQAFADPSLLYQQLFPNLDQLRQALDHSPRKHQQQPHRRTASGDSPPFPPSPGGQQQLKSQTGMAGGSVVNYSIKDSQASLRPSPMKVQSSPAKKSAIPGQSPRKRPATTTVSGRREEAKKTPPREAHKDVMCDVNGDTMFVSSDTKSGGGGSPQKRLKAVKKQLQFVEDDETQSPVSGMFIRKADDVKPTEQLQAEADLDDTARFVEVTDEARDELSRIPNVIGDYKCTLCKVKYDDAFKLAQHRCPRIAHEEYRCPECDKVFSCPANLASHHRWHKPQSHSTTTTSPSYKAPRADALRNTDTKSQMVADSQTTIAAELTVMQQQQKLNYGDDRSRDATPPAISPEEDYDPLGFKCDQCDKRFDSHLMLRTHAIIHTGFAAPKQNESINLLIDEVDIGNNDRLATTVDTDSTGELQCSEPQCGFWFADRISLDRHTTTVHHHSSNGTMPPSTGTMPPSTGTMPPSVGLFECRFCGRRLTTSPALSRHINKHHSTLAERVMMLKQIGCK